MRPALKGILLSAALSIVAIASDVAAAQLTGSLSGPVLGYLFDRDAGELRPVKGILGSSTVGAPVGMDLAISQVLTLDASHVIVSTQREVLALHLNAVPIAPLAIPDLPPNPNLAIASIQSKAAAFYYSDTSQVRIVTGFPPEPRNAGVLQIDQPLKRMAVNDEGTLLVYTVEEPEGDVVYAWTASSGSARFVTSAISIAAIAITTNGDAIVADRDANEVFVIWDVANGAIRRVLADITDGVLNPIGVAVSPDNRILVANRGSATVMALDSSGHLRKTLQCNCEISGLYPFRNAVFRLTGGITQTIFLLDASSAEERILFVPPPQE